MKLHDILDIHTTEEQGVFIVSVEITDMNDERYTCDYVSRAEDKFGLAPEVRKAVNEWLASGKTLKPPKVYSVTRGDVNTERDRRISDMFTFRGVAFQMDKASQQDVIAKGVLANFAIMQGAVEGNLRWADPSYDFYWIATNNNFIPMDAQTMSAFAAAADTWVTTHKLIAAQIKQMNPIPQDYKNDNYWPTGE